MIVNIINSIDYLYIIHGYYNDVKVNQIRGYHMGEQEFLKAIQKLIKESKSDVFVLDHAPFFDLESD